MVFFLSVSALVVAVVLFVLLLIVSRDPRPNRWQGESFQSNVCVPVIMFLGIMGFISLIKSVLEYESASISITHLVMSLAVVAAGGLFIKSLNISKRLREFDEQRQAETGRIINLNPDRKPEPPAVNRRAA